MTSPLREGRRRYVTEGCSAVGGWVSAHDFAVFEHLMDWQEAQGLAGHFCEIGVFEGKRFLFFLLSLRAGEMAVAIDVFDDTQPPRDFEPVFRRNIQRHVGSLDAVRILRRDSATVGPEELLETAGGRLRVFSVDGCHGSSAVLNDLRLACATLAPGGLVIVDDYFNETWPGVSEGTLRFLMGSEGRGSGVVPFAIFSTKLFLSHEEQAVQYREHLRAWAGPFFLTETGFLGSQVVTLQIRPPTTRAMRLAQTRLWQRMRGSPVGRFIRKARILLQD